MMQMLRTIAIDFKRATASREKLTRELNCLLTYKSHRRQPVTVDEVRFLLDAGADIHGGNISVPPIQGAITDGRADIVQLFLDRGVNPNTRYYSCGRVCPFEFALLAENEQIIKLMLERGANVDTVDTCKRPVFMRAALNGKKVAARLLLDHGADPDRKDAAGMTALDCLRFCFYSSATQGTPPNAKEIMDMILAEPERRRSEAEKQKEKTLAKIEADGMQGIPVELLKDVPRLRIKKPSR